MASQTDYLIATLLPDGLHNCPLIVSYLLSLYALRDAVSTL